MSASWSSAIFLHLARSNPAIFNRRVLSDADILLTRQLPTPRLKRSAISNRTSTQLTSTGAVHITRSKRHGVRGQRGSPGDAPDLQVGHYRQYCGQSCLRVLLCHAIDLCGRCAQRGPHLLNRIGRVLRATMRVLVNQRQRLPRAGRSIRSNCRLTTPPVFLSGRDWANQDASRGRQRCPEHFAGTADTSYVKVLGDRARVRRLVVTATASTVKVAQVSIQSRLCVSAFWRSIGTQKPTIGKHFTRECTARSSKTQEGAVSR